MIYYYDLVLEKSKRRSYSEGFGNYFWFQNNFYSSRRVKNSVVWHTYHNLLFYVHFIMHETYRK